MKFSFFCTHSTRKLHHYKTKRTTKYEIENTKIGKGESQSRNMKFYSSLYTNTMLITRQQKKYGSCITKCRTIVSKQRSELYETLLQLSGSKKNLGKAFDEKMEEWRWISKLVIHPHSDGRTDSQTRLYTIPNETEGPQIMTKNFSKFST